MRNMVVVHFADGRILKGFALDFFPNKTSFHLEREASGESIEVEIANLKGVFFVKTFRGDASATRRKDVERAGMGRKIRIEFQDGETMVGYTSGYTPARTGFFAFPVDPDDNNEKVFVITAATRSVEFV